MGSWLRKGWGGGGWHHGSADNWLRISKLWPICVAIHLLRLAKFERGSLIVV